MQSENPIIADFVKVANSAAGTLAGMGREARENAREKMKEAMGGIDFVSREEFDAVKDMAAKAREQAEGCTDKWAGGGGATARAVRIGEHVRCALSWIVVRTTMSEIERTVARLDALIRETVPDAVAVAKYGGTLYTRRPDEKEGQFCGVFPHARHVQLSFSRGAALDDPGDILGGGGKHRRHVNFAAADHVEADELTALVRQAAALGQ